MILEPFVLKYLLPDKYEELRAMVEAIAKAAKELRKRTDEMIT